MNAECAAKQVHFDACCTVIDKKQYDDKLEPAGFIKQSGAQDETEYYLPIGLKRLVQSAISFLVTGRQMIVTSWTKEGGDNVLDKNGGSLSILMMVLDRIGHPQYLADPGKLIKSRKSFLPMNRALTATYASLRIQTQSIGNTMEYKAGCEDWSPEDWKEQQNAEHKAQFFGGYTTSMLRREAVIFIGEYLQQHSTCTSDDALAELRGLSVVHEQLLGLNKHYLMKCFEAGINDATIINAQSLYETHRAFEKRLPQILSYRSSRIETMPDGKKVFLGPTCSEDQSTYDYLGGLRQLGNANDWRVKRLRELGLNMEGYSDALKERQTRENKPKADKKRKKRERAGNHGFKADPKRKKNFSFKLK